MKPEDVQDTDLTADQIGLIELAPDQKTQRFLARQHRYKGISKHWGSCNKNRSTSKARRKMAKASRRRNRK